MKTHVLALALAFVSPAPALAQRSAVPERLCDKETSHAEQRACLEAQARQSQAHLDAVEQSVRAALVHADQVQEARTRAVDSFDKSVEAFKHYRAEQCEFVASLAFGGNGQGDRRLLCQIELNDQRIEQLQGNLNHAV